MGVRFPFAVSNTMLATVVNTTTETLLLSSPPIVTAQDFASILIIVNVQLTTGTATTNYLLRIYRGTALGGPVVLSSGNVADSLGALCQRTFMAVDVPAAYGPVQYSLSMQQQGATGNGAVPSGSIAVLAL